MSKKQRPLSLRLEAELHERIAALVATNPIGTMSSFAHEAIRAGLPELEAKYLPLSKPQQSAESPSQSTQKKKAA